MMMLLWERRVRIYYTDIDRLGKQKNWIFEDFSWYSEEAMFLLRLMCHDVSFLGVYA